MYTSNLKIRLKYTLWLTKIISNGGYKHTIIIGYTPPSNVQIELAMPTPILTLPLCSSSQRTNRARSANTYSHCASSLSYTSSSSNPEVVFSLLSFDVAVD
jgi:hypothetical protein